MRFQSRSDINWAVHPQKMVRVEIADLGLSGIVLCSENKGADQLPSYHITDLCLCFADAKCRFSHDVTHITTVLIQSCLPDFILVLKSEEN